MQEIIGHDVIPGFEATVHRALTEPILLAGAPPAWGAHLGQSIWLREVLGREEGPPPPVDLPSLLHAFRSMLPGTIWAVTLYPADEGIALEGKLVRDLPQSALDKLHPQSHTQRAQLYKPISRTKSPAKRVVNGTSSTLVHVRAR